jgi:hypothetical protein
VVKQERKRHDRVSNLSPDLRLHTGVGGVSGDLGRNGSHWRSDPGEGDPDHLDNRGVDRDIADREAAARRWWNA